MARPSATATKSLTRSVKLADHRPPAEIRENTKARRAWLAAEVARLDGQPATLLHPDVGAGDTLSAKVVGQGSCQVVSVRRLEAVAVRLQTRGTCQGCASSVAVPDGVTSLHGYKRPGTGEVYGRCIGAGHVPAETSVDLSRKWIADLQAQAARKRATAETMEAKDHPTRLAERAAAEAYGVSQGGATRPEHRAAWLAAYDAKQKLEGDARNLRWTASQDDQYARHLTDHALPMLGQPFHQVPVPAND